MKLAEISGGKSELETDFGRAVVLSWDFVTEQSTLVDSCRSVIVNSFSLTKLEPLMCTFEFFPTPSAVATADSSDLAVDCTGSSNFLPFLEPLFPF